MYLTADKKRHSGSAVTGLSYHLCLPETELELKGSEGLVLRVELLPGSRALK